PLAHLFQSSTNTPGQSTVPIVGVAPKRKGKAATPYFGLENYEDWVFIYIPKIIQGLPNQQGIPNQQGTPNQPGGQRIRPPQVSQELLVKPTGIRFTLHSSLSCMALYVDKR